MGQVRPCIGNEPGGERSTTLLDRRPEITVEREFSDLARTGHRTRPHHPHTLQHHCRTERERRSAQALDPSAGLHERPDCRSAHERRTGVAGHHADCGRDRGAQRAIWRQYHRREHQDHAGEVEWLAQHGDVHLVHRRHGEQRQGEQDAPGRRGHRAHEQHECGDGDERGGGLHEPRALSRRHAEAQRKREHSGIRRRKMRERLGTVRTRPLRHRNAVLAVRHDGFRRTQVGEGVRVEAWAGWVGDDQHERESDGAE